jgi:hypothetical protein
VHEMERSSRANSLPAFCRSLKFKTTEIALRRLPSKQGAEAQQAGQGAEGAHGGGCAGPPWRPVRRGMLPLSERREHCASNRTAVHWEEKERRERRGNHTPSNRQTHEREPSGPAGSPRDAFLYGTAGLLFPCVCLLPAADGVGTAHDRRISSTDGFARESRRRRQERRKG